MSLWGRLGEVINYAGGFFTLVVMGTFALSIYVYYDSFRRWHIAWRSLLLSAVVALLQLCLFFLNPFYPFAFGLMLTTYILLGHDIPYAVRHCPSCSSKNAHIALICSNCGQRLPYGEGMRRLCPECKQDFFRAEHHCSNCGTRLIAHKSEAPSIRRDGGIILCRECGEKNVNWREQCWKCNAPIEEASQQQ